jgi:hypothetical protein
MTWRTGLDVLDNWQAQHMLNTRVYFISTRNAANNVRIRLWGTFIEGQLFPQYFHRAILVKFLAPDEDYLYYMSLAQDFYNREAVLNAFTIPQHIIEESGL